VVLLPVLILLGERPPVGLGDVLELAVAASVQDSRRGLLAGARADAAPVSIVNTAAAVSSHTSGMRLTDAHNGLRVLRRDVLAQLDLRQNRMAHASEIIRQIGATGMPWREFPVHIVYTDYSRAKGQSLWNSVNILVDLLFS